MTNQVLRRALACADRGWPVFPCHPGQKTPATRHGHHDATTNPGQITAWFTSRPDWNLAVATGTPGPDILDIDTRGPAGNGFPAMARLRDAGLLARASVIVRTPSGGLHVYFTGSAQRTGHLPAVHVDFLAAGGYALVPPSIIGGRPYRHIAALGGHGGLDWTAATRLLEPSARRTQPAPQATRQATDRPPARDQASGLARWVAAQPEGNRNNGLFWAANRLLEIDPAADLSLLAEAASYAGLTDPDIIRTLNSAHRTTRPDRQPPAPESPSPEPPSHQAEGTS